MKRSMSSTVAKIPDLKSIEMPYMLRVYGVTEEMFDEMVDDEHTKAELVDGVLVVHSPASIPHDRMVTFVSGLLSFYVGRKQSGIVLGASNALTRLQPGRRVAPDVFYVAKESIPSPLPKQLDGPPDLVVEVVSPSNRAYDLGEKRGAYRTARVKEIWLVDSERQEIILDRLRGTEYVSETFTEGRVTSAVVEGFWIDPSWLWVEPTPDPLGCLEAILGRK
ncbi:MAG: Uma2 family endonuclease [Vicinamibacteria bacterium]